MTSNENFASLDINNIIEELDSIGRSARLALVSYLVILLQHLYKYRYQPIHREMNWELSISNSRDTIEDILTDSPSLETELTSLLNKAHIRARRNALKETALSLKTFPEQCPWTISMLNDENFLPS